MKSVSESGSLTLQHISSDQEGVYTCELRTTDEMHITNIFLRLDKDHGELAQTLDVSRSHVVQNEHKNSSINNFFSISGHSTKVGIIVFAVIFLGAAVTGLVLYWKRQKTD